MSKLAKKGIEIPKNVEFKLDNFLILVKGPNGELRRAYRPGVKIEIEDQLIKIEPQGSSKFARSLVGTFASHIRNMIQGVTGGFSKKLKIEGTGYRFELFGKELVLSVGFSHPVKIPVPEGLVLKVDKAELTISGADKEMVGQFSAKVRAVRPPEPYKGKGIRYADEVIRRKQGKRAVAATA